VYGGSLPPLSYLTWPNGPLQGDCQHPQFYTVVVGMEGSLVPPTCVVMSNVCCQCVPREAMLPLRGAILSRVSAYLRGVRPHRAKYIGICCCVQQARWVVGTFGIVSGGSRATDVVCFVFGYAHIPALCGVTFDEEASCVSQGDEESRSLVANTKVGVSYTCRSLWSGCTHRSKAEIRSTVPWKK
jgi:hypothetical protein